ncbi:Uncharacterised protein [BD1-7 clade bacterium]|uniref:Uncharacterized protein n=1 Tax=BD1-7 clade bacterium TaxID=2029982 RepID=A0A5S9NRR0_9GAMM|nr:Uncharacterised protein [BD1-7 clade bacterium]CAA0093055.1 Uncharacterised protein [BD1-7 clade bacterium]CAA0121638.1 Uncharacterised protein [BD1-7 clade bacterium]
MANTRLVSSVCQRMNCGDGEFTPGLSYALMRDDVKNVLRLLRTHVLFSRECMQYPFISQVRFLNDEIQRKTGNGES